MSTFKFLSATRSAITPKHIQVHKIWTDPLSIIKFVRESLFLNYYVLLLEENRYSIYQIEHFHLACNHCGSTLAVVVQAVLSLPCVP